MYPRVVLEELLRSHPDWLAGAEEHAGEFLGFGFAKHVASRFKVEDWILKQRPTQPEIGAYLDFLTDVRTKFNQVDTAMRYRNPNASHSLRHDEWSIGWAGGALLPIANYLYVLRSFGVIGHCLECGAFKGSSTACLSYVCKILGLTLYCADSFAGLPAQEVHYGTGDFAGSRAEVESNVRKCGEIGAVRFIEGWYESSLRGFGEPLSLIWMDVDLQQSVLDVMGHVFRNLTPGGVIFSDGFTKGVDFTADNRIKFTGSEPAGFYRFFHRLGMRVMAIPAGPKGLALILPRPEETPWLRIHAKRFQYLLRKL